MLKTMIVFLSCLFVCVSAAETLNTPAKTLDLTTPEEFHHEPGAAQIEQPYLGDLFQKKSGGYSVQPKIIAPTREGQIRETEIDFNDIKDNHYLYMDSKFKF